MPAQLIGFSALYLLGGLGCLVFAWIRARRRHALELVTILCIWPLYAPFLLASPRPPDPSPSDLVAFASEQRLLEQGCLQCRLKLEAIDRLSCTKDWNRVGLEEALQGVQGQDAKSERTRSSLRRRLEQIDRLALLRKATADELEALQALLEELQAQAELRRFMKPEDLGESLRLDEIRERIARSEAVLAAQTELMSL